jgi:hypothetical protein
MANAYALQAKLIRRRCKVGKLRKDGIPGAMYGREWHGITIGGHWWAKKMPRKAR